MGREKQTHLFSGAQHPADRWGDTDGQIVHQRSWKSNTFFLAEAIENLAQILFWRSSPWEFKKIFSTLNIRLKIEAKGKVTDYKNVVIKLNH